jgi:hypothetical protein
VKKVSDNVEYDNVVKIPTIATVNPCSKVISERNQLKEALIETAALIENMVSDLDEEFLLYYSEYRKVLKKAREALKINLKAEL